MQITNNTNVTIEEATNDTKNLDQHIKEIVNIVLDDRKQKNNFILDDIWIEYSMYSTLNKQDSTIVNDQSIYGIHIQPFFGSCKLFDITPKDIISWHLKLSAYLAYQTIVNIHKSFSKILNWVNKIYDTGWNPLSKVGVPMRKEKQTEMSIWTEYEFFHFYSTIDTLEDQAIFMVFYFMGLRRGELLALRWNDLLETHVRIDESIANVKGKQIVKDPKSFQSFRIVEADLTTYKLLQQLHKQAMSKPNYHPKNYIFGRVTAPMAFETLRKRKLRYEEASNTKHIRIHDLRHSHVSYLINHHIPVVAIAKRIGDSIEEVLSTYAHILPQSSLEISNLLNQTTIKYQSHYDKQTTK